MLQQRPALIVGPGGRDNRDIHTMDGCNLVVLNLGEDELFFESKRVIAAAIEGLWRDTSEVSNPWQRQCHETIEELPHPATT